MGGILIFWIFFWIFLGIPGILFLISLFSFICFLAWEILMRFAELVDFIVHKISKFKSAAYDSLLSLRKQL